MSELCALCVRVCCCCRYNSADGRGLPPWLRNDVDEDGYYLDDGAPRSGSALPSECAVLCSAPARAGLATSPPLSCDPRRDR